MRSHSEVFIKWIAQQKRARSRVVPLAAAWFGTSAIEYVVYRFRYFALGTALTMCLHIAEFYLLAQIFNSALLQSVLLIRLSSLAISAAWWGALEIMRKRIRLLKHKSHRVTLARELGLWYTLGYVLCAICCVIAIDYVYNSTNPLSDLYCSAIFLTLGFQFISDTKKAGVYAVSRIWRPMWALLAIPFIGALLLLLWPLVGVYTIIIMLIINRVVKVMVSLHFTAVSQEKLQYPAVIFPSANEFIGFLRTLISWEFFAASLAFSMIDISGVLIGTLHFTNHMSIFAESAFIFFYFINPLLKADSEWAMLFYFDLKKYQAEPLEIFLPILTKKMVLLSPIIGFFFWCMTIIFTAIYFHSNIYLISLVFLTLFILRASSAFLQVTAFCQERYVTVVVCGVCIILSVVGIMLVNSPSSAILLLLIGLTISIASVLLPGIFIPVKKNTRVQLIDHGWYQRMKSEDQPVQLWHYRFAPNINFYQRTTLLKLILPRPFYERSAWFWTDHENVFGYTVNEDLTSTLPTTTARQAGLIVAQHFSAIAENGAAALQQAGNFVTMNIVGVLDAELGSEELLRKFQQQFPEGWCHRHEKLLVNPDFPHPHMPQDYYKVLLNKLTVALRAPCLESSDRNFDIAVAFPNQEEPMVFVIPHSLINQNAAMQWKKSIYVWNVKQQTQ